MQKTMMKIRSPKNPDETITDSSDTNFESALDRWIRENCFRCYNWKGKCRLEDQHGLKRMDLCISLSAFYNTSQSLDGAFGAFNDAIKTASKKTQEIAESTMKDLKLLEDTLREDGIFGDGEPEHKRKYLLDRTEPRPYKKL